MNKLRQSSRGGGVLMGFFLPSAPDSIPSTPGVRQCLTSVLGVPSGALLSPAQGGLCPGHVPVSL